MGSSGARDAALARALAAAIQPSSSTNTADHHAAATSPGQSVLSQHLLTQMHLNHGLDDEQLMGQLRRVRWFRELSMPQLDTLFKRARHIFFTRYSVLLREGNVGSSFFVLMQGRVRCTSAQLRSNAVLGAGASFGEGALSGPVIREATVVALEDSYLLQFQANDVADLPIEMPVVRDELVAKPETPRADAGHATATGAPAHASDFSGWMAEVDAAAAAEEVVETAPVAPPEASPAPPMLAAVPAPTPTPAPTAAPAAAPAPAPAPAPAEEPAAAPAPAEPAVASSYLYAPDPPPPTQEQVLLAAAGVAINEEVPVKVDAILSRSKARRQSVGVL